MGVVAEPDDELVDEAKEEEEVVVEEADELVDLWDCQNERTNFKTGGRSNRKESKKKNYLLIGSRGGTTRSRSLSGKLATLILTSGVTSGGIGDTILATALVVVIDDIIIRLEFRAWLVASDLALLNVADTGPVGGGTGDGERGLVGDDLVETGLDNVARVLGARRVGVVGLRKGERGERKKEERGEADHDAGVGVVVGGRGGSSCVRWH